MSALSSRPQPCRMKKILPLLVLSLAIAFVGCYDANDFVNPVYNCECGTMTYNGTELPLKMAEAIVPDSANPLSRRYHLVADLRSDAEIEEHAAARDLTVFLEVDTLDQNVFYIPADGLPNLIQEIDRSDSLFGGVRDFVVTNGVVQVTPAYFGGPEPVTFQFEMREVLDGELVGFAVPLSGTFTADI